jgi:spore coat protein A
MQMNRRELLKYGTAILAGAAVAGPAFAKFGEEQTYEPAKSRFTSQLRIPPVLRPARRDETTDYYEIAQKEAFVEILPGRKTRVWGYEGMFPGPTIKALRGRKVVVRYTNELSIHTVVHLHGGVTAAEFDGFPTDMIMPGGSMSYVYSNEGRGTTLWYHDHAMDHTGRNIYMGLVGLYLVSDEQEAALKLPSGEFDVPLLLQCHSFARDGSIAYHPGPGGQMGARGDTILVNGARWPRLEVGTRKYRFRILNASNARTFRLALSSGQPFAQIATDGGLLAEPLTCDSIPLAMAERVEIILDFSRYPVGSRVVLQNLEGKGALREILRFEIVRKEHDDSVIPQTVADIPAFELNAPVRERTFNFGETLSLSFPPITWTINGRPFDPDTPIAEVKYGDVEVWHLRNKKIQTVGNASPSSHSSGALPDSRAEWAAFSALGEGMERHHLPQPRRGRQSDHAIR